MVEPEIAGDNGDDGKAARHTADSRPSEYRLRLRVPADDMPAFVHLNKHVQRGVDDSTRHPLALQKSLLRAFPFRDVASNLGRAHDGSRRRADRRNTQGNTDRSTVLGHAYGLVVVDSFSARYSSQFAQHLSLAIAGNEIPMLVPIASRAEYPNSCSAARFQWVIVPTRAMVTMASSADCIAARTSCSPSVSRRSGETLMICVVRS